ncbi:MAG TPA: acetate uptake transporter [Streptosporangiaceae bacterium]|nr:acetate uptake transporter [Streptosporangiaceae bacterium]
MSVSEDRTVQPSATALPLSGIADPAPLGLAAFALTTFLLSAANANWMSHATGAAFLGYAFAYGGLIQLLAGMWEFRNRNVFGATAFSSYGGFWIGLALWVKLVKLPALAAARPATLAATVTALNHDVGWILLAFFIFNTYMLVMATQLNLAVFGVFLTLGATEIVLAIGQFNAGSAVLPTGTVKVGGYIGLVTALVAWYTSMAGVAGGMGGRLRLPVGRPLVAPRA